MTGTQPGAMAGRYDPRDERGYDLALPGGLTAEQAVYLYRADLEFTLGDPDTGPPILAALETLRGHDLACWCRLRSPCHRDVLLDLANR